MNEPTEIKYPLDENGEPYYAATSVQAIRDIDTYIDKKIQPLIEEIEELKEKTKQEKGE